MPDSFFTPQSFNLEKLFSENAPMYASRYQRDYAWEDDEVRAFTGDLLRLLALRRTSDAAKHFFGAIVAVDRPRREFTKHAYEILDGQQRLATFALTIAALRRRYLATSEKLAEPKKGKALTSANNLDRIFIHGSEYNNVTREDEARRQFQMVESDDEAFHLLLTGRPILLDDSTNEFERESHRLLSEAYSTIDSTLIERLDSVEASSTFDQLVEFERALLDGCEFIFIKTTSSEHATQLFQVLNDRGRRLEESDLLRAHTLMLLSESSKEYQNRVANAWDAIDRLPSKAVEDFLRHRFASYQGKRVPAAGIARVYRSVVFGDHDYPLEASNGEPGADGILVLTTVEILSREAQAFDRISRGDWPFPTDGKNAWRINRLYRLVRTLQSDRVLPLLLSAHSRGEAFFAEFVPALERLEFRAILADVEANKIANMYFDVAALIRSGALAAAEAILELESWIVHWKSSDELRKGISVRCQYGSQKSANYIKHLLTTVEDHREWLTSGAIGDPKPADLAIWDMATVQDEHIFPQNPAGGLPKTMGDWVHRLGNQTFWGPKDNRDASNLLPSAQSKISAYLAAQPMMTKDVGKKLQKNSAWGASQIEHRETVLVEAAVKILRPSAYAEALSKSLPVSRATQFVARRTGETKAWLVVSKPDSPYDDRVGEVYEYKTRLPNAKKIAAGDTLIVFRPKQGKSKKKGLESLPARIVGFGMIESIEQVEGGVLRRAHTSLAKWCKVHDIPISAPNGGAEPRKQVQNAMVEVNESYLDELHKLARY